MSVNVEDQRIATGFAGLSSLLSDVDSVIEKAKHDAAQSSSDTSSLQPTTAEGPEPEPNSEQHATASPADHSSPIKQWAVGIGLVVGFFWLISSVDKSSPSKPNVPSTTSYAQKPSYQQSPATTPPPPPQSTTRRAEQRPPVGTQHVLNHDQIRYCLSEDIRLGAARTVINAYSDSDINRFNSMVNDYNSRCSRFTYRRGSLESVRSDVERNRSILEAEGRRRFSKQSGAAAPQSPTAGARRTTRTSRDRQNYQICISGTAPSLCDHSVLTRDEQRTVAEAERQANLRNCLTGVAPSLCNQNLLTQAEARQVAEAERQANLRNCLTGVAPSLCNHLLLTSDEAVRVAEAERRAATRW